MATDLKGELMSHDDWKDVGDGWYINKRKDGTWLVWNEELMGGNKNYNHYHVVGDRWIDKPTRQQLNALKAEIKAKMGK
jgi:hypothetical protein